MTRTGRPARRQRLVVCGDDPLAHRLIEELVNRYQAEVTAIVRSRRHNHGPEITKLLGRQNVVESDRLDTDAFRQARVATADALALVQQDDVGNIHAALQAQELNPRLRLVMRMFNMSLGHGIRRLFTGCRVLSDAEMAAPAFVSAALGEVTPVHIRLARRTLYVARRADVRPADIICGLAATDANGQPVLLPADQSSADLVLAVATGAAQRRMATGAAQRRMATGGAQRRMATGGAQRQAVSPAGEHGAQRAGNAIAPMVVLRGRSTARRGGRGPGGWLRDRFITPLLGVAALMNRKLRLAALAMVALLILGTGVLALVREVPWWDAAYLTLLTELGGANPDLGASPLEKITQTVLTMVSIALIPVVTAAVVEAVVNARLALALGRLREPIADHVVVVGLGNVGTRVIHALRDLGIPVVAIDLSEGARGVPSARARGIPVVIGNASQAETLRAASVQTCRALVVVSTDDVINLEAALQARELNATLRVVLRLFDGDFADRVQRAFGITSSRSVSFIAAPAFAAALQEQEVISTIPINRRLLLVAEATVCPGSALDGVTLATVDDIGEVRILAVINGEARPAVWAPPPSYLVGADDVLIVVASRGGLGRLLARTGDRGRERSLDDPAPAGTV